MTLCRFRTGPVLAAAVPLGISLILSLAACARGAGDEEKAQPVVGVRIAVVGTQPFTETLGAIGTVTGRAGHVATLGAPLPARIARVAVAVGQRVGRGSVLLTFDQTSFAGARRAADAALATAQRNAERTQRLVAEGIAPRKELEQATAELAQAMATDANARRDESLSVLRSPIPGVVTRVAATLGAMADPSQPLVEIADPAALDLIFNVTPGDAARIAAGAKVRLVAGESAAGEPMGIGTVVDIGGAVDTLTRSVSVRAQATTTRRPLRLGETIYGLIEFATREGAVVVPVEALVPDGEGMKVFVVDAAGIAHARPVKLGGRTNTVAEVVEGLRAGERVVTYGAYGVDDSVKVVPLAPSAPTRSPPAVREP